MKILAKCSLFQRIGGGKFFLVGWSGFFKQLTPFTFMECLLTFINKSERWGNINNGESICNKEYLQEHVNTLKIYFLAGRESK